MLVFLFSCSVNKKNKENIVLVELKSKIDRNITFIDTLSLSGNLWSIGSKNSSETTHYRIFVLHLGDEDLWLKKNKSFFSQYLSNGYVYLLPNEFTKLLYKSDKNKYFGLKYKEEIIEKMFPYVANKKHDYYPVKLNDEFIMILVHVNFYKEVFHTEEDWLCNDTYIKVITQNCLYFYDQEKK